LAKDGLEKVLAESASCLTWIRTIRIESHAEYQYGRFTTHALKRKSSEEDVIAVDDGLFAPIRPVIAKRCRRKVFGEGT
jgi:hypothetical protein